jgi:hypothetical protein
MLKKKQKKLIPIPHLTSNPKGKNNLSLLGGYCIT